ncbi:MAG: sugar ABC transporter permease [Firmicutes bacterium]|nr:sugar ABC transporter permease [Bacillota bacterium]
MVKELNIHGDSAARSPAPTRRRHRDPSAYLFILPTFVFIGALSYYPALRALVGAFTSWNGVSRPHWVGLANFVQAFHDGVLGASVIHVLIWAAIGIPLALVPSFVVAESIFRLKSGRAQYIYRTVFILPIILPSVVGILIWFFFYEPGGIVDALFKALGIASLANVPWLADPHTALGALIFMGFPWIGAFNLLIYYAGLQGISSEIFDATEVDGCSWWTRVRKIDIPLLAPQTKLLLVLSVIGVGQILVQPLLMTGGGPGTSTVTPVFYMYQQAITYDNYGYSMAIAFLLFVVLMGLTLVNMKYFRTNNDE